MVEKRHAACAAGAGIEAKYADKGRRRKAHDDARLSCLLGSEKGSLQGRRRQPRRRASRNRQSTARRTVRSGRDLHLPLGRQVEHRHCWHDHTQIAALWRFAPVSTSCRIGPDRIDDCRPRRVRLKAIRKRLEACPCHSGFCARARSIRLLWLQPRTLRSFENLDQALIEQLIPLTSGSAAPFCLVDDGASARMRNLARDAERLQILGSGTRWHRRPGT